MTVELSEIAKDWAWLTDLNGYQLLAISPFGDLLLEDETGAISLLDINCGQLESAQIAGYHPAELFPIAFDDRIAAGYRKAGLVLSNGQCYGYKQQLVTGATLEAENVYVTSLAGYLSFMGSFHDQIKDVVDGETVTLKIVPRFLQ